MKFKSKEDGGIGAGEIVDPQFGVVALVVRGFGEPWAEAKARGPVLAAAPSLKAALETIAAMEPGSRGAYRKFQHAQNVAQRALRDIGRA